MFQAPFGTLRSVSMFELEQYQATDFVPPDNSGIMITF